MSEKTEQVLSEDEIWKAHILKARSEKLSDVNYCQKYEVSVWRFTKFKKKLGLTRVRPERAPEKSKTALSGFVKAVVSSQLSARPQPTPKTYSQSLAPTDSVSGIPDPAWLAQLLCAVWERKP